MNGIGDTDGNFGMKANMGLGRGDDSLGLGDIRKIVAIATLTTLQSAVLHSVP